jgi:hypothetical protein
MYDLFQTMVLPITRKYEACRRLRCSIANAHFRLLVLLDVASSGHLSYYISVTVYFRFITCTL